MGEFNDYLLRKWSRACRLRDENTCCMCGRVGGPIETHHIYPKSLFPEKAYALHNGVSVCYCCHRVVLHQGNTFDSSLCLQFTPYFLARMRHVAISRWNEKYQPRIREM